MARRGASHGGSTPGLGSESSCSIPGEWNEPASGEGTHQISDPLQDVKNPGNHLSFLNTFQNEMPNGLGV